MCVCVQMSAYINIERLCIKYMHSNTCIYFFFLLLLVCSCAQLSFLNISSAEDLLGSSWNKSLRHTYTGIVVGHKCFRRRSRCSARSPMPGGVCRRCWTSSTRTKWTFCLKTRIAAAEGAGIISAGSCERDSAPLPERVQGSACGEVGWGMGVGIMG